MVSRSRPPVQTYIQDSIYGSTVPDPFHQEELASQLKREMLLISLAGPMTNIVLAAFFYNGRLVQFCNCAAIEGQLF